MEDLFMNHLMDFLFVVAILFSTVHHNALAGEIPRRTNNAPTRQNNGSPSSSGFSSNDNGSPPQTGGGSRPNTYLSRNPERAALNNNKNKFDFDGKPTGEEAKNWKSGQIFNQKRKSQRNDPWWMRYHYCTILVNNQ